MISMLQYLLTVSQNRAMLLHELDAGHPDRSSPRAHFLSHDSSKSFLCLPARAGHSLVPSAVEGYTIFTLCCKVCPRNPFSISCLRTLSFSLSCNPCICHSYENCRVCTNNSHSETRRREPPSLWRKTRPSKSFRIRIYKL